MYDLYLSVAMQMNPHGLHLKRITSRPFEL